MTKPIPFCPKCNAQSWTLEEQYESAQYYYHLNEEGEWTETGHNLDDNINYYECEECGYKLSSYDDEATYKINSAIEDDLRDRDFV